ncbi:MULTISPECIES: CDP-alcohol phosphatidyltransferase family protein [unclassified Curtobacterium]|jgi:cardiolipin synthase|uniref:CDP-alcohol phosphatidyltransferase family protein n=1 Tax=unclassified Curtobacterium TaxID=257496 RepID=UPI00203F01A4|nr:MULTISPECIES: CDP-alcohol phosphatidyltransferase family protein [unclassified Curtobacterium]MCM3522816.1 CDP-alcohol phosphatidyltransferase family protein [Curtobacterium sp. P97]MDB6426628.1 CDP-alcohol phosphatidyltransferase family protein [Curtobacterium sp. 20TX0008]
MTDTARRRPDWQTWPNLITLVRFLLIPVFIGFVVAGHPGWALVTLVVLGVSDWADGFIARRFDQGSKLGKALDPIADRLAIIAIVLSLVLVGLLPWPSVAIIVLVDAVLALLSGLWFRGNPDLDVTWTGKVRSALLFVGLPLLLFSSTSWASQHDWIRVLALVFVWAGTIGHVVAGVQYARALAAKHRATARTA